MGALRVPRYPERHGAERFSGPALHSSAWDHHVDLAGKNVAVVGTGASAIRFVPQIAPRVGRLYLFQRTPPWIVPRLDFAITDRWKRRFIAIPLTRWAFRQYILWRQEVRGLGFLGNQTFRKKVETLPAAISRAGSRPQAARRADTQLSIGLQAHSRFG